VENGGENGYGHLGVLSPWSNDGWMDGFPK